MDNQQTIESRQSNLSSAPKRNCPLETSRKKCAVFSHNLERNGANKFLLNLLEGLSKDLEFELFSTKSGPIEQDFRERDIPIRILQVRDGKDLENQLKEIRHFDLSIINTIMLASIVLMCEKLAIPHIWVIHEVWPRHKFEYYAKEVFLMSHVVDRGTIVKAFAKVNRVVFPSKAQRKLYSDLVSEEKAKVIYNGILTEPIDDFKMSLSLEEVRKDLHYQKDDNIILHIGTVCKRKAQKLTVSAFAKFCEEHEAVARDLKLLIVGARHIRPHEIQYLNELKTDIKYKGIEDKVQILETTRNVLSYYFAADVVVCPSLNDALPMVIGEAMACERPVIASKIGGIPEALNDGQEGFLIPYSDVSALAAAMGKLLNDKQLRIQMGQQGRERILKQFSLTQMVKKYRQVISTVCPECFPIK